MLWAEEYLVKPGDTLGITVLGEPDLTKRVVVNPEGGITLPLVNDIPVAGLTTTQAAQAVAERLKQFIKNPQVSIELLEAANQQVTVSGEIKNPGVYPLPNGARLIDVVTAAGGYTAAADLSKVAISRAAAAGSTITVDLSKFLLSGDASTNVLVGPGDTVIVPTKETAVIGTVSVLGAVRQSGQYPITKGMTVCEGVMLAGGPTEQANLNKVSLRREGAEAIPVDYLKAAGGDTSANVELKPGDVVYVAALEPMGTYTIQGAVGSPGKYELRAQTSITEAIAIAGGVKDRAKLSEVRVLRSSSGATQTIQANVSDIMSGKAPNIPIQDRDSIYIPEGKAKTDAFRIISLAVSLGWLLTRR